MFLNLYISISDDLHFPDFGNANEMSETPNIPTAFVTGTIVFSTTAFVGAGTYAIFRGHHQAFRYSFFTALNVGVAGGLFAGILL